MEVEIEIRSEDPALDLVSLKTYLEENSESLTLRIQSRPAPEGTMSIEAWKSVGEGILEGAISLAAGKITSFAFKKGTQLYKLIKEWRQKQAAQNAPTPEGYSAMATSAGITIKDGNKKIYITEDRNGKLQVFDNFEFAIDADRTYALLIGNSEFDGNFPAIPPVRNNLVDLYNLLTDKRHGCLLRENVSVLWNKTSYEIEEALLKMGRTPGMETFILYYSGHGHKADRESLVLTAKNTKKLDEDIIGGINFSFITDKVLKRSTAKQKILVFDACHSGLAAQGDFDPVRNFDVTGTYILTSSGDEASYFEKSNRHTFFTGALLHFLSEGMDDTTREMLSLEDIYKFTFEKLREGKFPEPHFKNQLNIAASSFMLARNPQFSTESLKEMPEQLITEGKTDEAFEKYQELVRRFPDDDELRRKKDACGDLVKFNELVHAGDLLYLVEKNYKEAIEKYKQALKFNRNELIVNKIRICREFLEKEEGPPIAENKQTEPLAAATPAKTDPVAKPAMQTLGSTQAVSVSPLPIPAIAPRLTESYSFTDDALVISYTDGKKEPLTISYSHIFQLTFKKATPVILVKYSDKAYRRFEQKIVCTGADEQQKWKAFLLEKTKLRKQERKTTKPKEIFLTVVIAIVLLLIYIGITTWAKEAKEDNNGELGNIIVLILAFIGKYLTPGLATGLVSAMLVFGIIGSIIENIKSADEVYAP